MSSIEWTEKTWNPATGCTKVSPGCKNCYAETMAKRLKSMGQKKYRNEFEYTEHHEYIMEPIRWKKSCKVFVNSMSDLFHELATHDFLDKVFDVMIDKAPQHTYQILTKRPHAMSRYVNAFPIWMPENIWCGTSVESPEFLHRIDELRKVNAQVRFVSFEPLLAAIGDVNLRGIHWAIIGGESGPNYRPVQENHIKSLIEQCEAQNVKIFFKQWGGRFPKEHGNTINNRKYEEYP